jgi:cytochrome c peroxidase
VAFGIDEINSKWMFYAIAQFQSMLVSANSKYDKYMLGEEIIYRSRRACGCIYSERIVKVAMKNL